MGRRGQDRSRETSQELMVARTRLLAVKVGGLAASEICLRDKTTQTGGHHVSVRGSRRGAGGGEFCTHGGFSLRQRFTGRLGPAGGWLLSCPVVSGPARLPSPGAARTQQPGAWGAGRAAGACPGCAPAVSAPRRREQASQARGALAVGAAGRSSEPARRGRGLTSALCCSPAWTQPARGRRLMQDGKNGRWETRG